VCAQIKVRRTTLVLNEWQVPAEAIVPGEADERPGLVESCCTVGLGTQVSGNIIKAAASYPTRPCAVIGGNIGL